MANYKLKEVQINADESTCDAIAQLLAENGFEQFAEKKETKTDDTIEALKKTVNMLATVNVLAVKTIANQKKINELIDTITITDLYSRSKDPIPTDKDIDSLIASIQVSSETEFDEFVKACNIKQVRH